MNQHVPVGIDLGTSRIRVAYCDAQGHLQMLRDDRDDVHIVNAVRFKDQEIIVGKDALADASLFSQETAIWIKRELGSQTFSRAIHGQRLPPEVIQACVLRKVRLDLLRQTSGPFACVVGVPTYFDEIRRNAVVNAGQIAGLRIIDVIDEPLASVLAYAYASGRSQVESSGHEQTILVFDLGSSGLQVALVRLSSSECRILAKDQDLQLGGYDFDVRLGEIVSETMIAAGYPDPRADPAVWARVYPLVVDAKHGLSSQSRVHFVYDQERLHFELILTREQFEACTAPLIRRMERLLGRFLERTGLSWHQIDLILPVGGAVRTPSVLRLLSQLSGRQVLFPINVDEAVAKGAALFSAWKLEENRRSEPGGQQAPSRTSVILSNQQNVEFGNLLPYAVGVRSPDEAEEETICLVSRATPLPLKVTRRLSTRGLDKGGLTFIVAKNEHGTWEYYGRLAVQGVPETLPPQAYLELIVECQVNGRLRFHARLMPTAEPLTTEFIVPSAIRTDTLERWQRTVELSSSWDELTQAAMEPRTSGYDGISKSAGDEAKSGTDDEGSPTRERTHYETELLPRRRHPRLAAAEAQGRWQPLEIALPPPSTPKEAEPQSPSSSPSIDSTPELAESPPGQSKSESLEPGDVASGKRFLIPAKARVTREALLESLLGLDTPTADVNVSAQKYSGHVHTATEGGFQGVAATSDAWAGESKSSPDRQSFRSRSARSVRVLLPFGLTAPRWLIAAIGFVISALLGLGLGYWIIIRFLPSSGILKLW